LLFGFTVWSTHTVMSYNSGYSFPVWESLEYNRTGETSLWESGWGYVEFTPTRTFQRRYGGYLRDCRNFLRVVVRNDGFERRYRGTACRNPNGSWWIASSARVF
jgi:surface antigen